MRHIPGTLSVLVVLLLVYGTGFGYTHIETSTSALLYPATPVGTSSVLSYTITYIDGAINEPFKVDVTISGTAASRFQYRWDNSSGTWSNFPAQWALTAPEASRTIYVRYTPTDDSGGTQATILNTMSYNFPGAGWFVSSTKPTVDLSSTPLPVQLSSFTADALPSRTGVELKWTTVSEINNYGFFVQRGSSKTDLTDVAFVPGHGTTLQQYAYSWVDETSAGGFFRLRQVDMDGAAHFTDMIEVVSPAAFSLGQNFPNPFNPQTMIHYQLSMDNYTTLRVYDILGREVAVLVNEMKKAGSYQQKFNGAGLASGVYIYRLTSGQKVETRRMILSK